MKRLCVLFGAAVAACGHARAPAVTLAAATSAPVAVVPAPREELPPDSVRLTSLSDASWARAFAEAKGFIRGTVSGKSVLIGWHLGVPSSFRSDSGEEFPDIAVTPLELNVGTVSIPLGSHVGTARPPSQSYCLHLGWHLNPDHADAQPEPRLSILSSLSIGTMQGDTEVMIVRDGASLHVLHRETSDGKCDEAKQGPLDVCEGFEWERVAEVRLAGDPVLYERLDEQGKPFDCGVPTFYGKRLLPPRPRGMSQP
jgi:hypothetical protein